MSACQIDENTQGQEYLRTTTSDSLGCPLHLLSNASRLFSHNKMNIEVVHFPSAGKGKAFWYGNSFLDFDLLTY